MKTNYNFKQIISLVFMIIFGSGTATAQAGNINLKSIQSVSGTTWIGTKAIAYNKVDIIWQVDAEKNIKDFEVEYSIDLVNFTSAGKVKEAIAKDETVKTFRFEHTSKAITGKNIVQYRIKQTDIFGTITYSEIKMAGLKS